MRVPKISSTKAKAKVIDLKKDKIVLAGLALLAGLMAAMAFSANAHATQKPRLTDSPQFLLH